MTLTDFNIDLTNNEFQPVSAFSASKNAFLILASFTPTRGKKDYYTQIYFKIFHLNNDLNYNRIINISHKKEEDDIISFNLCMGINKNPVFGFAKLKLPDSKPEIYIPKGKTLRIHLEYRDNCSGPVNSGNWPCNNVKVM